MSKDEEIALKLIELSSKTDKNRKFKDIDKFFPYTNEDIRNYSEVFDYENKNVLTVCGSGDQVFNAIALGAKEITTFDINIVALYHLELKKAIIEHFDLKTFLNFYKFGMNKNTYIKVREYLSENCLMFWDKMYTTSTSMFKYFWGTIAQAYNDYIESFNLYLDKDKYEFLKDKLKDVKITSFQSDILNLDSELNKKFDIMIFSNILNVLRYNMQDLESYRSVIKGLNWYKEIVNTYFLNNLNNNGRILVNYSFGPFLYNNSIPNEVENFFIENQEFSIFQFTSNNSFDYEDKHHILLYKKQTKTDN